LGTLAKFPQLLLDTKMVLSEDDFVHPLHRTIFVAIKDIVCKDNSIKGMTHKDIDDYLSGFDELYGIWNQYNGLYYMEQAIEHSNANTFKLHYQELLKYSLMRQFGKNGVDVTQVYDYLETDLKHWIVNRQQFEAMDREDVEKQLMALGKGNVQLQNQLSNTENEIDSQIKFLMVKKKNIADLRKKLIFD